jgi:hypothetical protein
VYQGYALMEKKRKECLSDINSEKKIEMESKGIREEEGERAVKVKKRMEEEGERAVKVKKRMDMLASLLTD